MAPSPGSQGFDELFQMLVRGESREVLAGVDELLKAAPESAELHNLRGLARVDLMDLDCVGDFEAAIARDPDYASAHMNLAHLLLMRGEYARGWREYAWRTGIPHYTAYDKYDFGIPRWNGEPLAGRRLLVQTEQGFGDAIQFARFFAPLAAQGAVISVFCQRPLASLLSRVAGVSRASANWLDLGPQDFYAPMFDAVMAQLPDGTAPHWFGPYVTPLPERVDAVRPLLAGTSRPLVGIAWKGSPTHKNDAQRSLPRETARALLRRGATFVNLQLGEAPLDEAMIDAIRGIVDFEDTAALVSLLDRVVAVDTAIAHLAGAMGKPVTLLVAFTPDWRWRASGETTAWYPSMRLARQSRPGDWTGPIEAASAGLGVPNARLDPRQPPPQFTRAQQLRRSGQPGEARAALDDLLRATPDSPAALNLRALSRLDQGDLDGARADLDAAIAEKPDFAGARYNRGMLLLLMGDYERGWGDYAWRARVTGHTQIPALAAAGPRWSGEDLAGRTLLVHAEQGLGDTIQFARFLTPLARVAGAIDVFCPEPLVALMARVPGVRSATSSLAEGARYDFHASMIDVAAAQLPRPDAPHWWGPYVQALAQRVERIASRLANAPRPLVGIAWKGSALHSNDANRSLSRAAALKLIARGGTWVDLQLGERPLGGAIEAASAIRDWDDTAAFVSLLDHVVSVDTAVAHLAGAMGKPVTVLVPFAPDWRWGASGEATAWYPSMRLVRQSRAGDWTGPIEEAVRPLLAREPG